MTDTPSATITTSAATTNPLVELRKYGQSAWLDYIRRTLITGGELKRLVDEDGLGGVTSNPAIFEKAITGSTDYADALAELQKRKDLDPMGVYEIIAIEDIQNAADILRPVYDETKMRDGYVSLEVSPFLARDTEGTLKDARRLWKAVNRPNLLVKVPATQEGIPAIEQLISEGINVNVTLLFAQEMYEKVALAYIAGLKKYVAGGGDPSHVSSVASFFISRIDSMVDSIIKAKLKATADPQEQALLKSLPGKVAIANGKLTYQRYKEIFSGADWSALVKKGAQTQRVLWASTSTKDPSYSDVLYVEELIGPDTVNTMPPQTLEAFRDHGKPKSEPGSRPGRRSENHGHAREGRHFDEESDRRPGDPGREAVRRAVRQAAERGGRQVQVRVAGRSGRANHHASGEYRREAFRGHRRLENGGQGAAAVGARRVAVDRIG